MSSPPPACPAYHIAGRSVLHPPRWLRLTLLTAGILYWLLICTLTHLPPQDLPTVGFNDKLAHFLAFGLFGGLLFLTLWALRPRLRWVGTVTLLTGALYGALDELTQPATGRTCDPYDWLTDVAALLIAVILLTAAKSLIERRLRRR